MPTKLLLSPVPTQLQTVHRQFEQWRRIRRPGTPIPPPLWTAAVAAAPLATGRALTHACRKHTLLRRIENVMRKKIARKAGLFQAGAPVEEYDDGPVAWDEEESSEDGAA